MDHIAYVLSVSNKELVSVDFWKSYTLSPIGLRFLTSHVHLEEIDLGWWSVYIKILLEQMYKNNRYYDNDLFLFFLVWP